MGAIGQAMDLAFKISAQGGDAARAEIDKTIATIKGTSSEVEKVNKKNTKDTADGITDVSNAATKGGGALSVLAAGASAAAASVVAIAAATAGALIGLTALANAAAKSGQDIYKLQQATGLSAETLTSLRLAAIDANVELGTLNDILVDFTTLMKQAASGNEEAQKTLEELGVSAKNADEGWAQLIKNIYLAPDAYKAAEQAAKATGASLDDLLRIVEATKGNMDALRERAKALGITLDNDAAKAANEFAKDMEIVTLQVQSQAYAFAREYMPQISSALRSVGQFIANNKEAFIFWGQTVAWWIAEGVKNFIKLTNAAMATGTAVWNAMRSMAYGVGEAFTSIGNAIGGLIGRFTSLIGLMIRARLLASDSTGEASAGLVGSGTASAGFSVTTDTAKTGKGGSGSGGSGGGGGGGETAAEKALKAEDKRIAAMAKKQEQELALARAASATRIAINEQEYEKKTQNESLYFTTLRQNLRELTAIEIRQLELRAAEIKLNKDAKQELLNKIAVLKEQLKAFDVETETEKLKTRNEVEKEHNKLLKEAGELMEKIRDDAIKAERGKADAQADQKRVGLKAAIDDAKTAAAKKAAIIAAFDFEKQQRQRRQEEVEADIENDRRRAVEKLTEIEKQAGAEQAINDRARQQDAESKAKFDAAEVEAERKKQEDLAKVKPAKRKGFKGIYDDLKDDEKTAKDFGSAIEAIGNKAAEVMQNMGNAVGDAIAQWALYGGSVGKALKQALAAELAYLAGWATVQALRSTAWGFLMLATGQFDKAGAAFLAAGLFAALAGGSALAARALSGGGKSTQNQAYDFRSNTIDSNNSSRAAGNTTQMLSESRTQRQDQRITLEVTSRDSHIVRVVGDNLNQRGDLFPVVVRLVEQN